MEAYQSHQANTKNVMKERTVIPPLIGVLPLRPADTERVRTNASGTLSMVGRTGECHSPG